VTPSWSLIISHSPAEDRAVAEAAFELARTRIGPFSWSHRIHVGDATRSILMVGETSASDGENSVNPHQRRDAKEASHARLVACHIQRTPVGLKHWARHPAAAGDPAVEEL